jgi:hypothetical protein
VADDREAKSESRIGFANDRRHAGLCDRLAPVIDVSTFRLLLLVITGWLDRRERETIGYLIQENRLLHR